MARKCRKLRCTCDHDFQDRFYGRKVRLHNRTKQNQRDDSGGWRCTVCGDEK